MLELGVVLATLVVFATIVGIRWSEKKNAALVRVVKAPAAKAPEKPPETEHERLIRALTTIDQRAADRMYDLKWFLFWLPFAWGVIYGIIWIIILETR